MFSLSEVFFLLCQLFPSKVCGVINENINKHNSDNTSVAAHNKLYYEDIQKLKISHLMLASAVHILKWDQ